MLRIAVSIITALLAIATVGGKSRITEHNNEVEGSYNFLLAEPLTAASDSDSVAKAKPLIVFLHGASLCGKNLERVKRYGTIDAIDKGRDIDAYVIAPQNPGGSWKPEKLMNLVEWAERNFPVDTNRVYVLGMSLGGYGTLDFAAAYPDKIAAAIGICGGATRKDLSGLAKMPLWIVHGTADRAVSVRQSDRIVDIIAKTDSTKSRLIYDRVPGLNHGRPARMLYAKEVYAWLLAHSLADENRTLNDTVHFSDKMLRTAYDGLRMTRVRRSVKKK